jgi:hypothetical protein
MEVSELWMRHGSVDGEVRLREQLHRDLWWQLMWRRQYSMNTEELKLIAEALNSLGDAGKWAFIAYIVKDLMISLFGYSIGVAAIVCLYKTFKPLVLAQTFAAKVLRACGVNSMEYDWNSPDIDMKVGKMCANEWENYK